jgi:hypothetical protein
LDDVPDNLKPLVNPIYLPEQRDEKGNVVRGRGQLYTGAGGDWATKATAPAAPVAPTANGGGKPLPDETVNAAQALIAKDPTQRAGLIRHFQGLGYNTGGL